MILKIIISMCEKLAPISMNVQVPKYVHIMVGPNITDVYVCVNIAHDDPR
jgi:hypothetical protein